ncbi:hypothetical protein [Shewanella woodyi]|uniref:hypothetical protein n=1 Tax=Shewanella woodyi TaxID=60961 RepID=UPI003747FDA9
MEKKYKFGLMGALLVAMVGLSGQAHAVFYDLYSGMLNQKGDQLLLSKCGIVSVDFILEFETPQLKEQLPDLAANGIVQLHVRGKVEEKDGQYHLTVHDINHITVGSSCDLLDVSVEERKQEL